MEDETKYGVHRVLELKKILPQPAWKINNTMDISQNEVLIEVKIISINSSSFRQICTEHENDIAKIKDTIFKIVELRGKLHNPVTNTGGILYGRVKKTGAKYENLSNIKEGDYVIPLVSLSMIPLKLHNIHSVDINSSQLQVEGEAILFSSFPLVKIYDDIKIEHLITLMDEAGSCFQSYNLANKNDRIIIMGANGKIGLLCAFAVREKIGKDGEITGIVYSNESKALLERYNIFDKIYVCDATEPIEAYKCLKLNENKLFDLTINCINTFETETFSILLTRNGGTIYFSSLTINYNTACLTAEGMGKEINIVPYKGYLKGHADFTINIFNKYSELRELIDLWMKIKGKINIGENYYKKEKNNTAKNINLNKYVLQVMK